MQPGENSSGAEPVALEYLRQLEDGTEPELADYERRLDNEDDRTVLRELVGAARWARDRFPAPFRAEVIIDGRYRLIRQIGAGGYGKVWLAEDVRLARDVALKIVTAFGDADAAAKEIRKEVNTLGRLSHRGIVRLYDSGTHDGSCYLAMEHLPGKSLADLLELLPAGPIDAAGIRKALDCPAPSGEQDQFSDDWQRFAAAVVVELLWALAAAHGSGVVHRDLKPANVMLTGSGRPILLDFGLAGVREAASGTITKGLFGTTPYLAPEQLADGRSGKSTAIDIYQTGLILYELLTRRRAFAAASHERLVRQILEGVYASPRSLQPDLPRPLEDIVLRAMARDPARRYSNAEAFRVDLERWLEGAQPSASAGGALMRVARDGRTVAFRQRRVMALAGALLLGALPVWLMGPANPVQILAATSDRVSIRLDTATTLMSYVVLANPNGKILSFHLAKFVDESGQEQQMAQLEPGDHHLRVKVDHDLPELPPGTELRAIARELRNEAEIAAWQAFRPYLAQAELALGAPIDLAEMARLQQEATSRGEAPPLSLDRVFGDGTLAGLGVPK